MASNPPPFGYEPPTPPSPHQPTPPPPGPPGPPAPPLGGPSWGTPPPQPPKRNLSLLWVVLGAVVIAAVVAGAIVFIGGGGDDDSADTTERTRESRETRPPRRTTTTTTAITTTSIADVTTTTPDPTTTTPDATTVPPTSLPPEERGIDIGRGVSIPLPEGWERTDGPGDEVVQISNGSLRVDAQALQRDAGEDPASAMQEYIDLFDADFAAVGYTPVTLRSRVGADGELRNYGLYYRAIDPDFTGFDGAVYLLQRSDGLTVVLDYYSPRPSESAGLPDEDYDALIQSILDAPSLGASVDVPESSPFRIESVHPSLTIDGLAAVTLPPDWVDQSRGGAVIGYDGSAEWAVMTKISDQADADLALSAFQDELLGLYPDLEFGEPSSSDAWDDLERRDVAIDAPEGSTAGPDADSRPRTGGASVYYDPVTDNAYGFALIWFADELDDGSEPSPDATDFIYDVFVDSFDDVP